MSLQEKEIVDFDEVFKDAKSKFFEVKPGLEVDTAKELELLMHKFKELSQATTKAQSKPVFKEEHFQVEKPLKDRKKAKRIRVPRWMSKNIAEYDMANQYWTVSEAKTKISFHPFSRTVYLPDGDFLVIGGLNDQIAK